jgi:hypothetical protein
MPAWAQMNQIDSRYFYLQADYIRDAELEAQGETEDGDGWGAQSRISFTPHAFLSLDYHSIDNSNGDLDTAAAGLGLRTALYERLDLHGSVHYEYLDLRVDGLGSGDADGYSGRLGLCLFPVHQIEFHVEGRWADFGEEKIAGVDIDIDSQFINAGMVLNFTEALASTAEYLTGEYELDGPDGSADVDREDLRVGLRWYLDP